ncbi:hypothetical protein I317_03980 [Kwoniella heveanensis CBS 569]|nr:hypothetical protein I317_03980 [Kwoniella heveanensis CBS 569]
MADATTLSPTAVTHSLEPPPALSPRASTSSSPGHSLDLPSLQPLSHSHPLLSSENFDADLFLLSRIHIPLEELRGELRGYLGELREELVRLINEDYEEFISLGTGLRGEENRLRRLGGPLNQVKSEVQSVRDVLAEHQGRVQSKLDERAAMREEKALLDLLQRLFDTLSRAEALLDQKPDDDHGHGQGSAHDQTSNAKLVTRVAGEYTQVVYLANKARLEGCRIVEVVQERVENIKSRLSRDLSALLSAELEDPKVPRLKSCLKTYELIEGWAEAEEVFRGVVKDFCSTTITPTALTVPTTPTAPQTPHATLNPLLSSSQARLKSGSDTPLASLYNRILSQVEIWSPLLQVSEDISDRFDFYSNVIWPEIADALVQKLGSTIFAAGRPDELHKHYTTTHDFITQLESLAPSARNVHLMRSSASYESFERRWQLPVYFQLRWKEIVGTYEANLAASSAGGDKVSAAAAVGGGGGSGTGTDGWALGATAACWKALETSWSEEVFIPELAPRFWRLSLQITSRLGTYLKSMLESFTLGEEDTSQEDAALRFASAAIVDLDRLRLKVGELEVVRTLQLQEPLSLPITSYFEVVLQIITRRCVDPLKLIRSIASQFRASPSPSSAATTGSKTASSAAPAPSYFIPQVLKPLHNLFDVQTRSKTGSGSTSSSNGSVLKEKYGTEWTLKVIEAVFANYASILSSVRKTEDLLRKHRKSKKVAGGLSSFFSSGASLNAEDGGAEKEEERFRNQMRVDIHALRDDVLSLEVKGVEEDEIERMESWKELVDVVNRPAE